MSRAAAVLALALWATAAQAGPWGLGNGGVYAKMSYGLLRSTRLANPDGSVVTIPRFTKHEAGLYLAYGVGDRVTVIASLPAYRSSRLQDFGAESGIGDVQGGLQVQLGRRGPWVFAARATAQAPTGDVTRAEGLLPTGSGVWEGDGVISAGRSLAGGKGYGFVEAGHQVRGGGLRDGLVYAAQVGWNATKRLTLAANLHGVEPYDKRPRAVAFGSFIGVGDRVTYAYYGPSAIFKLGRHAALQLDAEGVFHARNLARGLTVRAGVAYSR